MTMVRIRVVLPVVILTFVSELEPRRTRDAGVDMFIDLGATNEDHGEVNLYSF